MHKEKSYRVCTPGGRSHGVHLRILPTTDCRLAICTPYTTEPTDEEQVNLLVGMIDPNYQGKLVAAMAEATRTMLGNAAGEDAVAGR